MGDVGMRVCWLQNRLQGQCANSDQYCGICYKGPSTASSVDAQQPESHGPTSLRPRSKYPISEPACSRPTHLKNGYLTGYPGSRS